MIEKPSAVQLHGRLRTAFRSPFGDLFLDDLLYAQ